MRHGRPPDDIVFHDADSDDATEKWQSKHTINQTRSLSDASSDLWKTLANWITEPGDPNTPQIASQPRAIDRIADDVLGQPPDRAAERAGRQLHLPSGLAAPPAGETLQLFKVDPAVVS